jgi:PmbA protein
MARKLGASDAGVEVSEGVGLSVSVRKGELENVERNRDKSLGVSVYLGQRRGNASTSDFSPAAIAQTVQAAYDIARFTAEDPAAGLPDADDLATPAEVARDLDLFHPWAIDAAQAAEMALRCEPPALATSRSITNSEGAGVSAQQSHFWAGNSARLPRRLRQFAALRVGVADRRARPRHAARQLVHLDARRGRAGVARGRWAAMPPSARCRG